METLLQFDRDLFVIINGWNSPCWDDLMVLISSRLAWLPVYLLLFVLLKHLYGWKGAFWLLAIVGVGILISDQVSSSILKPMIERLRPCHDPALTRISIHLVNGKCGGQYGFVSSHAANFGFLASFLLMVLQKPWRWVGWLMAISALVVGYSRIYLGVHYPGDVVGGLLLGYFTASLIHFAFTRILTRFSDSQA